MIDSARGKDRQTGELVNKVLFLTLASIVTSANAITHAIYDLCTQPELVGPLLEEIRETLKRDAGWSLEGVQKMDRLDSFLKESQRLNHPGLLVFNRKVMKDVVLSDGTVIPAGTFISAPTHAMARDAENYPCPLKFDALRFYRLREKDPVRAKDYLFSETSPESLPFGWGAFACPGRNFASCQIKIALSILLLRYRIKFPDGQVDRPPTAYEDDRIWPNRTQSVGFQSRRS